MPCTASRRPIQQVVVSLHERYPIAFASIKPNHTVAFAAYPATSYWGPITAETNYVNMIKPEVVLNAEAEMSEVGRLLDFPQHHETLQTF